MRRAGPFVRAVRTAVFVTAALLSTSLAVAETWPAKPVRLIIPFAAGGSGDVIGRIVAERLTTTWHQPVVADNHTGAGGNVASQLAAKASPDGYTLLLAAISHVTNGALYKDLPYDPIKDFAPICLVSYYGLLLVINPALPITDVKGLVAYARAHPDSVSFGSAGTGTPTHLAAELFATAAGIKLMQVAYKGAAPATNDLMGGQIQAMFNNPISALTLVKAGKLRALATTGPRRSPFAPDLPTVAESGYPGFEAGTWFGLLGPAGMPAPIVAKIAADTRAVLADDETRKRFAGQGVEPMPSTPDEMARRMRADLAKWTPVIRNAHITVE